MLSPNQILIISPTQEQSNLLFQKIRIFAGKLEAVGLKVLTRETTEYLEFDNGSTIKSLPIGAEGKTIRGHTANVIILEEAGFIKDSIINEVVTPMGAAQKDLQIIKIGTPFAKNHFYQSAKQDSAYTVHAYDYTFPLNAGLMSQEFIDEQKRNLGETSISFRTEYGAEFLDEADSYYGYELATSCINDQIKLFTVDFVTQKLVEAETYNPKNRYVLTADLARLGDDRTVIFVWEFSFHDDIGRLVYWEEHQKIVLTETETRIAILNKAFNFTKIFVDATGLGAGVYDHLRARIGSKVEGVEFNKTNKEEYYSNLRVLLTKKQVQYPKIARLIHELSIYRYVYNEDKTRITLSAPEGEHDDFVTACALVSAFKSGQKRYKPTIL